MFHTPSILNKTPFDRSLHDHSFSPTSRFFKFLYKAFSTRTWQECSSCLLWCQILQWHHLGIEQVDLRSVIFWDSTTCRPVLNQTAWDTKNISKFFVIKTCMRLDIADHIASSRGNHWRVLPLTSVLVSCFRTVHPQHFVNFSCCYNNSDKQDNKHHNNKNSCHFFNFLNGSFPFQQLQ